MGVTVLRPKCGYIVKNKFENFPQYAYLKAPLVSAIKKFAQS